MGTNNSYGAKAHVGRKANMPRRETTLIRTRSKTISSEELSFYTELAICILKDTQTMHCEFVLKKDGLQLQKEYARDAVEIRRRVAREGLSFLTKTLPALGKAIDIALATGSPIQVRGFELNPATGLPRFLGGLLELIFMSKDDSRFCDYNESVHLAASQQRSVWCFRTLNRWTHGSKDYYLDPYASVSPTPGQPLWSAPANGPEDLSIPWIQKACGPAETALALKLVRQLCYSFYKLELEPDEKVHEKVIQDFVAVDNALPRSYDQVTPTTAHILRTARGLISRVLDRANPADIGCRHGPGAVSTGELSHQKPHFSRFYNRLNKVYPYDQYFFYNQSHLCDRLQEFMAMENLEAGTAKVVLVPKDSRGPRLISCEPLEYQWIQQGQMKVLVDTIESSPLTRGKVNFRSQDVNRHLALDASKASTFNTVVTLDMKEASDRVSVALVRALFPERWFEALMASRSTATRLPDGTVHTLNKFAPMGSAVCFPVEALIFWALGVAVSATCTRWRGGHKELWASLQGPHNPHHVYVYGDDIICEGQIVNLLRPVFEELGLMLNSSKCCTTGFFRESCGLDAYLGVDVTPAKFRQRWSHRYTPDAVLSWVAQSNALYYRGYANASEYVEHALLKRMLIPYVNMGIANHTQETKVTPSFLAFDRPYTRDELTIRNARLRTRKGPDGSKQYSVLCPSSQKVTGSADGWEEMLYHYSVSPPQTVDPEVDNSGPNILYARAGVYSVRRRVKLKRRWMPMS